MDNSYYTTTTHSQMEYAFPNNTNESNVVYHRNRTGSNYFRVYYKNAAYIRMTPKQVGAVFGVARFTPSVKQIRPMMVILTTLLSMVLDLRFIKTNQKPTWNQMTILRWLYSNE